MSLLGEVSAKGRKKFQDQLEETHALFKGFVKAQRPGLDIDQVATGEYWLGKRGLELGLVDKLSTSDDYLLERARGAKLFSVSFKPEESWRRRLGRMSAEVLADGVSRAALTLWGRLQGLALR